MYLKTKGPFDGILFACDIANNGKLSEKTLNSLLDSGMEIIGFEKDSMIERYKNKAELYDKLHPTMTLNEEWIDSAISLHDLNALFQKFMYPLNLDACELTIIDPYIFANGTNVNFFITILNNYVVSKKVRFITNNAHINSAVKSAIMSDLKANGFSVRCVNNSNIHDRWWFSRKEGFAFGTSFNGLQRKNTICKMLDNLELTNIISIYGI